MDKADYDYKAASLKMELAYHLERIPGASWHDVEEIISRFFSSFRDEVLEEAAKIPDNEPCTHCDVCPKMIARMIRTLKS